MSDRDCGYQCDCGDRDIFWKTYEDALAAWERHCRLEHPLKNHGVIMLGHGPNPPASHEVWSSWP
jgi:hypothetical protein